MSEDKDISVTIQTSRGTRDFQFSKQTKVSEVIAEVVKAFGFAPGDRFELVLASNPSQPLDPNRPLVSFHITDGTVLILTSTGSGV
jgi:hypothetical protein